MFEKKSQRTQRSVKVLRPAVMTSSLSVWILLDRLKALRDTNPSIADPLLASVSDVQKRNV